MARGPELPFVPQPSADLSYENPVVARRDHFGFDAYTEVRSVAYGTAPIAVVRHGPTDLSKIIDKLEPDKQDIVRQWSVLEGVTSMLRSNGHEVTVYGGPGDFSLRKTDLLIPRTQEDADRANVAVECFADRGRQFVTAILQSR